MHATLTVNGFREEAFYDDATVETVLRPLLNEIGLRAKKRKGAADRLSRRAARRRQKHAGGFS